MIKYKLEHDMDGDWKLYAVDKTNYMLLKTWQWKPWPREVAQERTRFEESLIAIYRAAKKFGAMINS